jgi:hypothetical protein
MSTVGEEMAERAGIVSSVVSPPRPSFPSVDDIARAVDERIDVPTVSEIAAAFPSPQTIANTAVQALADAITSALEALRPPIDPAALATALAAVVAALPRPPTPAEVATASQSIIGALKAAVVTLPDDVGTKVVELVNKLEPLQADTKHALALDVGGDPKRPLGLDLRFGLLPASFRLEGAELGIYAFKWRLFAVKFDAKFAITTP